MEIKLSDYIVSFLKSKGINWAFGMSGGAAVHMFDSINSAKGINILSMTHEQCAAIAADGYYRSSGKLGVAISTSGPGATNLLTGTCCSFYDSIPTLMLTGQVSTSRLKKNKPIRQLGFQETDILSMFKSITKFCVQLEDKNDIKYYLEKAYHIAFDGRPGPVLIDLPDDLQRSFVDPKNLKSYEPNIISKINSSIDDELVKLMKKLKLSKRPVIVLGGGLKTPDLSNSVKQLYEKLSVPVLVTWAGLDLIENKNGLNFGTFGVYGSRLGNWIIQNSDLILVLGSRLSQNMTGGVLPAFGRNAEIIMVDNDQGELDKFEGRGIKINQKIHINLKDFIKLFLKSFPKENIPNVQDWFKIINNWQETLKRTQNNEVAYNNVIDAEKFVSKLSDFIPNDCHIYVDTGGNLTWTCNNIKIKYPQKIFSSWNHTPMGYSLPASIGAALSQSSKEFICIIGDGGLMLCLAELATVSKQNLPIKIVLINNRSHGIQKQTLETWLDGRKVGVDGGSGVAFPKDWSKVANSMGLKTIDIKTNVDIEKNLAKAFHIKGPLFINVEINENQKLHPFLKFGDALEDQSPKIIKSELEKLMIIEPYNQFNNKNTKDSGGQGW